MAGPRRSSCRAAASSCSPAPGIFRTARTRAASRSCSRSSSPRPSRPTSTWSRSASWCWPGASPSQGKARRRRAVTSSTTVESVSAPAIVAVDADASALCDTERELRDRYARHYRVICLRSAGEARARLDDLATAGEEVALVLAGQWLSETTGSDLLEEARHLHRPRISTHVLGPRSSAEAAR